MDIFKNKWFRDIILDGNLNYLLGISLCLILSAILGYLVPVHINKLYFLFESNLFYTQLTTLFIIFVLTYLNRVLYNIITNKYAAVLIEKIRTFSFQTWIYDRTFSFGKNNLLENNPAKKLDNNSQRENDFPLGQVQSRIIDDTESIKELVTSGTLGFVIDLFFIVFALIALFKIHFLSALIVTTFQAICIFLLFYTGKYIATVFINARKSSGRMIQTIGDVLPGVKDLYYIKNNSYISKRSIISFNNFLKNQLHANVWDASFFSISEGLYPLLLTVFALTSSITKVATVATMAVIIDLIQRSINPIKEMASKMANIQKAYGGLFRVNEFIGSLLSLSNQDVVDELKDSDKDKLLTSGLSESDFKLIRPHQLIIDVNEFAYKNEKQNRHFSLGPIQVKIKAPSFIGIIGESGSGKSTFLKILAGTLFSQGVKISFEFFSGDKLKNILAKDRQSFLEYQDFTSLITQDSHIFTGDLLFNLTLGKTHHNVDLTYSHLLKVIPYLGKIGWRLKSKIEPEKLSHGQRQLICALRCCFLYRPIVLLDEVSSAMDSELEFAMRQAILLIQKNSFVFIVAHRPETVLLADKIMVFKDGRLIGLDKHEELISNDEYYKKIIDKMRSS